ncbi:MAG: class II aldolase/adducin family protein [Proteobacteria bacterium]|nr:class II aldolase/adducin family protein [Pseudomonadota bacterium]
MDTTGKNTADHPELSALRAFSARIGRDRTLIQGAGGNTSLKLSGMLFVKASGTWLSEAEERDLFMPLPLDRLSAEIERTRATGEELRAEALSDAREARPSIETVIHGLLPKRVVVHVHSVNTIVHAARGDGESLVAEKLTGLDWTWIPYARPGRRLALLIEEARQADIYVLANHGLIVQADNVEAADALLAEVERRLHVAPRPAGMPRWDILGTIAEASGMQVPEDPRVHAASLDQALAIAGAGALYPDHVVYLGASPLVSAPPTEAVARIDDHRRRTGKLPDYLVVPGAGVLLGPEANRCVAPMLDCLGMVLSRLDAPERTVFLSTGDEGDLIHWDQEKHRMRLAGPR